MTKFYPPLEERKGFRPSDLLLNYGWLQGIPSMYNPDTREPIGFCLLGAVAGWYERAAREATKNLEPEPLKHREWVLALDEALNGRRNGLGAYQRLAGWNDRPGRTLTEVLALLEPVQDKLLGSRYAE